jgi:hypothetical protein
VRSAVFALWFCACSSSGDALVVVTVSSAQSLSGIQSLHVTAGAAGHDKTFDASPIDGGRFSIPPDVTFGVEVPAAYTGSFSLSLDAVDADGHPLGSGSGSTTTSPGKRSDLAVAL